MSEELRFQEIQCVGTDEEISHPIHGNDVVIKPTPLSPLQKNTGSNKVKVSQISKYDWKEKYYLGNLVSCNETYISYVLQAKQPDGGNDTVRVINQNTSERVLLKGFTKRVVDIAFESLKSNRLACVDCTGTLYIYEICEVGKTPKVESKLLAKIVRGQNIPEVNGRISWAPDLLVPVDSPDTILALSTGTGAIVFNLEIMKKRFGNGEFTLDDIKGSFIELQNCHSKLITCLALSPDKRVLATSSVDGDVKFWSLNFDEDQDNTDKEKEDSSPSCLHEWEPHGGEAVTTLFFCDDLLIADDSAPFWRYLITGTYHNTVLKIWCAVKWECLQTIRFAESTGQDEKPSKFKVALDITAKYLLLADIHKPVLYICQIHKDVEQENLSIFYLSEFVLKDPLLSLSIYVAKERKTKSPSLSAATDNDMGQNGDVEHDESMGDINEDSEETLETDKEKTSIVTLFAINKMALQKLSIKFKGAPFPGTAPTNTTSQEDLSFRDALSDIDVPVSRKDDQPVRTTSLIPRPIDVSALERGSRDTAPLSSVESNLHSLSSTTNTEVRKKEEPTLLSLEEIEQRLMGKSSSIDDSLFSKQTGDTKETESPSPPSQEENVDFLISHESLAPRETSPSAEKEQSKIEEDKLRELLQRKDEKTEELVQVEEEKLPKVPSSEKLLESLAESVNRSSLASAQVPPSPPKPSQESGLQNINDILLKQQSMIMAQQKELSEIKDLVKVLLEQQTKQQAVSHVSGSTNSVAASSSESDSVEDIKVHMQLLQKSASSQFSKASKDFSKQCTQKLDNLVKEIGSTVQEKEDRTVQILSNIVNNTIAMKLEKTIKNEMKQTVLHGMEKVVSKYFDSMNNQIAQKLSLWERTLKEECADLVKSKPLAESIGYAAASILEGTIPNAYRESFQNILLPGFEKASMAMFMQINQTFQQGTKQYLEKLEQHLDSKKTNLEDSQEPLISSLHDLVNSFQGTADRLTTGVESNLEALMQKQLRDATDRMQSTFGKTIESRIIPSLSKTISKCADEAFNDWKHKIDSSINAMVQSASHGDHSFNDNAKKRELIGRMIEDKDYNSAFEVALSASDLSIVLFACQQVEPIELFNNNGSSTLTQPIILSLVQQLSQNLLEDTDIKTRYLEESLLGLNKNEDITRTHLPNILQSLDEQLTSAIDHFRKQDPVNNQMIKSLKMLQMASKGISF